MPERTKTIHVYEFFYPDARPHSASGFVSQEFRVDLEAGDKPVEIHDGVYLFIFASGREVAVQPTWLWVEEYEQQVKVQP